MIDNYLPTYLETFSSLAVRSYDGAALQLIRDHQDSDSRGGARRTLLNPCCSENLANMSMNHVANGNTYGNTSLRYTLTLYDAMQSGIMIFAWVKIRCCY